MNSVPENILVAGGGGFIGSHLCKSLVNAGKQVSVLKRINSGTDRLAAIMPYIRFYNVEENGIAQAFRDRQIDVTVNCATIYGRNAETYEQIKASNLDMPTALLNYAIRSGARMFVNIDTFYKSDYGFLSHYSTTKEAFRIRLKQYSDVLSCINIVPSHVYGEDDAPDKFVPAMIISLLHKHLSINLTKGEQKRDFLYVDDFVRLCKAIIGQPNPHKGFEQYYASSGNSISIRDLMLTLKELCDNDTTHLQFGALPYRTNEIMESVYDSKKTREAFGWNPVTVLRQGLKQTVTWYRDRLSAYV
jgi:nucleoside-diphosphate-sugar epimerase